MKPWHPAGVSFLAAMIAAGCSTTSPSTTGGVTLDEVIAEDGRSCGRGMALIQTDYQSANVALLDFDGYVKSPSFIHSGAGDVTLTAPIGGDPSFPSGKMNGEVVLIDRYPASVLTFVDIRTARVRGQLNVRTGFDANPRDYLALDDRRALVSRYETNKHPGEQEFDQGDDLLVINPRSLTIDGRVDLGGSDTARQRPSALLGLKDEVVVSIARLDASFSEAKDAQLLILDRETLEEKARLTIEGMQVCEGIAASSDENTLAVSCSAIVENASAKAPSGSGLVVFSRNDDEKADHSPFSEMLRERAVDWKMGPFGFSIGFADAHTVVVSTFGALEGEDAGRPDRLFAYDLDDSKSRVLLELDAFNLGNVLCSEPCHRCFVTDASGRRIHRLDLGDEWEVEAMKVDTQIQLPPRVLALF